MMEQPGTSGNPLWWIPGFLGLFLGFSFSFFKKKIQSFFRLHGSLTTRFVLVFSYVHLVPNHSSAYMVFCLHVCFSKVSKNSVSRGPPVLLKNLEPAAAGSLLLYHWRTTRYKYFLSDKVYVSISIYNFYLIKSRFWFIAWPKIQIRLPAVTICHKINICWPTLVKLEFSKVVWQFCAAMISWVRRWVELVVY